MAFAQKLAMLSFFALLSLSEQKPTAPLRNLVRSCSNYKQANLRFHYKHFGEILLFGLLRRFASCNDGRSVLGGWGFKGVRGTLRK